VSAGVAVVLSLAVFFGSADAIAQVVPCGLDPALRISETSRSQLTTWSDVRRSYQSFVVAQARDDGAMADGYSDAVVHLLATRWRQLSELGRLGVDDASFRAFVLRHIGATADENELAVVTEHTATVCPQEDVALCQAIEERSRVAPRSARDVSATARDDRSVECRGLRALSRRHY
jgi:hypothetical protein